MAFMDFGRSLFREIAVLVIASCLGILLVRFGASVWVQPNQSPESQREGGETSDDQRQYVDEVLRNVRNFPLLATGRSLPIKDMNSSHDSWGFLMVLSPVCSACAEDLAFYATLLDRANNLGLPVYIALPDAERGRDFVSSLRGARLLDWEKLSHRVRGTPTLAFFDPNGVVRRTWLGVLDQDRKNVILTILQDPEHRVGFIEEQAESGSILTLGELRELEKRRPVTVINLLERSLSPHGGFAGAKNIPLEELQIRAPFELRRGDLQVVDCSDVTTRECSDAIEVLKNIGLETKELVLH